MSITGKLLIDAVRAALLAFIFGLCLGRTLIKHFDGVYFTGMILSCVFLISALFWTHRVVRPLVTCKESISEAAGNRARQFLWSCVFFSMISATFGIAVSGFLWHSTGFIRTFGVVWWAVLSCVAIFIVRRDAKRVEDAASTPIAGN